MPARLNAALKVTDYEDRKESDSFVKDNRAASGYVSKMFVDGNHTLYTDLTGLLPGTEEYYKEQAILKQMAEDEAAQLKHIQWELSKCRRIDRMLKAGKYDEALSRLKQDLDFQDFTSLQALRWEKMKARAGPPQAKKEEELTLGKMLSFFLSKIVESESSLSTEESEAGSTTADLAVTRAREEERQTVFPKDRTLTHAVCSWRKEIDGEVFTCTNIKCRHSTQTQKDAYGNPELAWLPSCTYHLRHCLSDHGNANVVIGEPNALGLCNECHLRFHNCLPARLDPLAIPGVVRDWSRRQKTPPEPARSLGSRQAALTPHLATQGLEKELPLCSWEPDPSNAKEMQWTCENVIFQNPSTREYKPFCAYHVTCCWMPHAEGDGKAMDIRTPNEDATCDAHYMAEHRRKPPLLRIPYPGMVRRTRRTHPLGPVEQPGELVIYARQSPSKDSDEEVNRMAKTSRLALFPFGKASKTSEDIAIHVTRPWSSEQPPGLASLETFRTDKAWMSPDVRLGSQLEKTLTLVRQQISHMFRSSPTMLQRGVKRKRAGMLSRSLEVYQDFIGRTGRPRFPREQEEAAAALTIQAAVRRHLARQLRHGLWVRQTMQRRLAAIVRLQAWARVFPVREAFRQHLRKHSAAVTVVATQWRGFRARQNYRQLRAARKVVRALARNFGRLIKQAYESLMTQRRHHERREAAAIMMQKTFRGYVTRRILARRRLTAFLQLCRAMAVVRCVLHFRGRLQAIRHAAYVRRLQHLWLVLEAFLRSRVYIVRYRKAMMRKKRRRLKATYVLHRFGRVALAKCRAYYLRELLQGMWRLWAPRHLSRATVQGMLPRSRYGLPSPSPADGPMRPAENQSSHREMVAGHMIGAEIKSGGPAQEIEPLVNSHKVPKNWVQLFVDLDPERRGVLKRPRFEKALTQMWDMAGHRLREDEAEALIKLFTVPNLGMQIGYRPFLAYAAQQLTSCMEHNRYICGTCYALAYCFRPRSAGGSCHCKAFELARGRENVLCICGHGQADHTLVPKPTRKITEGVSTSKLSRSSSIFMSILQGNRRVRDISEELHAWNAKVVSIDMPSPISDTKSADREQFVRTQALRKWRLPQEKESYREWNLRLRRLIRRGLYQPDKEYPGTELARQLDFSYLDPDDRYPQLYNQTLFLPRPYTGKGGPTHTSYMHERQAFKIELVRARANDYLPSWPAHISQKEQRKFVVTDPIPICAFGKLRLSVDFPRLYLHLLSLLKGSNYSLLNDEAVLTNVVAHYDVFLQRFWKDLLQDVRTGTVNPKLSISAKQRASLEGLLRPDPMHAQDLEKAFVRLGFCYKLRGKLRRGSSREQPDRQAMSVSPQIVSTTTVFPEYASPFRLKLLTGKPQGKDRRRLTAPDILARHMQHLKESYLPQTVQGTPKPVPKYRRQPGSVNNIDDLDLTNRALFDIGYDIATQPLPRSVATREPHMVSKVRQYRHLICGFPGCGKAFSLHKILKKHQAQHDYRTRLAAAIPASDQFMWQYFPKDASWLNQGHFNKFSVEFPFACFIEVRGITCSKRFRTHQDLARHLRCGHTRSEIQKMLPSPTPKYDWGGKPRIVPPCLLPPRVCIPVCVIPSHTRARLRCRDCHAAKNFEGPQAPFKLHEKCTLLHESHGRLSVSIHHQEVTPLIVGKVEGDQPGINPVHCLAICEDARGIGWMSCSRYLDIATLKRQHGVLKLPQHTHPTDELMECYETEWVRLEAVQDTCYTLLCDREEFKQRKMEGSLPRTGLLRPRFCRHVYSIAQQRFIGRRVFPRDDEDVWQCSGIDFGSVPDATESSCSRSSTETGRIRMMHRGVRAKAVSN